MNIEISTRYIQCNVFLGKLTNFIETKLQSEFNQERHIIIGKSIKYGLFSCS